MSVIKNDFFRPTQISGCQLWLDATDPAATGVPPINGSTVATWVDKSGSNNSMTSVGSPTYQTNPSRISINGAQYLESLTITSAVYTAFYLFQKTSTFGPLFTTSAVDITGLFPNENSTMYLARANNLWYTQASTIPNNQINIVGVQYDGASNAYVWLNGTINAQTTVTGTITRDRLTLGYRSINNQYMAGSFYEVIQINSAISTSQRQQVEGYLAWKWGLQANLPATHPYKSSPIAPLLNPPTTAPAVVQGTNPLWSPRQVSGCELWLDAADTSSIIRVGSNVTQWTSKGTTPIVFTTSVTNPTYISNFKNNLGAVSINGNSFLTNASFSMSLATRSVFMVVEQTSSSGNNFEGILILGASGVGNDYSRINSTTYTGRGSNAVQNFSFGLYGNNGDYNQGFGTFTAGAAPFAVYSEVFATNSGTIFVNGSNISTDAVSSTPTTGTGILVGSRYLNSSNTLAPYSLNGYIYEIIVYSQGLTTNQRQEAEGYLAWKWGLQTNLPITHPYKSFPPAFPPQANPPRSLIVSLSWAPTQITGISLWLDAADSSTITTSNTSVTAWSDKSGNNNNPTFSTAKPTYIPSNKYVETFNNNTDIRLPNAAFTNTTNQTAILFIVYADKQTGSNTYQGLFSTLDYGLYQLLKGSYAIRGNMPNDANYIAFKNSLNTTNTRIYSLQYTAGIVAAPNYQGVVNGNVFNPVSANTQFVNGDVYLGGINNFDVFGDIHANLKIQEIIIYKNVVIGNSSRQKVEGYLAWKWGLQASLPATHPFRSWPPPP